MQNMKRPSKKQIIISMGLITTAIAVIGIGMSRNLATVIYSIEVPHFTQTIKIALLTDLHGCHYGAGQRELLDAVHALEPDVVLFGGDILDDKMPWDASIIVLSELGATYPAFYVTGNHEYRTGKIPAVLEMVQSCGVRALINEVECIEINGQSIVICGLDDDSARRNPMETLNQLVQGVPDGTPSVLLTHRPEQIEAYLQFNFDIILSGHAHGGQWRIPGVLNGLLAPNQGLCPVYAGGLYPFEETDFIVSRGLAKENISVPRIFNPPELVLVELKPVKNS